jgi:hypothetical protein
MLKSVSWPSDSRPTMGRSTMKPVVRLERGAGGPERVPLQLRVHAQAELGAERRPGDVVELEGALDLGPRLDAHPAVHVEGLADEESYPGVGSIFSQPSDFVHRLRSSPEAVSVAP